METAEALSKRVRREQELWARLRLAAVHLADAEIERTWAIVSAHRDGLSIRQIAGATELSSSRVHQILKAVEATEIPVWLSQLRSPEGFTQPNQVLESTHPDPTIRARMAGEVGVLRRCIDWLEQLDRGQTVTVNLRPDTDSETEFVSFDRLRVVRVLKRIAADLDDLARNRTTSEGGTETDDARTRHRRELAEPPRPLKKLSHREQRDALRKAIGLPPHRG